MLRRMSPLLAHSGHRLVRCTCLLLTQSGHGPLQETDFSRYHAGQTSGETMRRREFITLLGGTAATWPLGARAQQAERVRRIGVFMNRAADNPEGQAAVAAFRQALEQLGWATTATCGLTPAGA